MSTKGKTDLIFGKGGKPFANRDAAFKHLVDNKLSEHTIVKHGGGYALALTEGLFVEEEAPVKQAKMEYKRVMFANRIDINDPKKISLAVNNVCLVVERNKEVILPESHLEVARNATYDNWDYDEKTQEMVNLGAISRYPFSILGDATEAEFNEMRKAGNETQRKEISASK